jgi:hypothetical protein
LWREKVDGVWLYGTAEDAISAAVRGVSSSARQTLDDWFLGLLHPLSGYIAKYSARPMISKEAVHTVIRHMLRIQAIDAVAILTNSYQPYLAAVVLDDHDEVERQVAFIKRGLATKGRVEVSDLPPPRRPRTMAAWRETLLKHGEYLTLGRLESGALVRWQ